MRKFEDFLAAWECLSSNDISIEDLEELEKLLSGSMYNGYNVNCFCIHCNETRTFESVDKKLHEAKGVYSAFIATDSGRGRVPKKEEMFQEYLNRRYCLSFRCTREHEHSLLFDLIVTENKIIKIGQYPSFADISIGDIRKYKSALGIKFKEYSRSLGLFSHGIGIGSFVYLRRIIEWLVFEKYEKVKDRLNISHDDFNHSEFKEKLEILQEYLPSVLVKNKNLYGIVSKGIHELSEEECLSMYPYIKTGIELILDDIIAEKERLQKEKIFDKFVEEKTSEFRKS